MTFPQIITYVFAALGSVAFAANVASTMVPKDSTLGLWLAWLATMPVKHAPKSAAKVAKIGTVLLALFAVSGCSILRSPTFWDATEKACQIALTARPEVQSEAKRRNLTGNEWAAVLCNLSDVIEQYVVEPDVPKATDRALFFLRPKGLVK